MTRWSPEEDARLEELAADGLSAKDIAAELEGRTEGAVSSRAALQGVKLTGGANQSARDYIAEGGALVRDEIGGVVGVRWARATRCGETYATRFCERLVSLGRLAPVPGQTNVFVRRA